MKKLVSLLLSLFLLLSLTGGLAEGSGEVVTLKLMMSQTQEPGVSAAVAAFNEAYKGKIFLEADYLTPLTMCLRRWKS